MRWAGLLLGGFLVIVGIGLMVHIGIEVFQQQQQTAQWYSAVPEPGQVVEESDSPPAIQQETYHYSRMDRWGELVMIAPPDPFNDKKEKKISGNQPLVWKDRPKTGEKVGTLVIPRIEAKIPIWEGVGDRELSRGIGHHVESVLPGEPDTAVLAGHRESALRRADRIRKGDQIKITTREGIFTYRVKRTWITDDGDRTVIASTGKPLIRLYSCWPLDAVYTGYAPKRYVIEAELTDITRSLEN